MRVRTKMLCSAGLCAGSILLSSAAAAQHSLSLSYGLDSRREALQPTPTPMTVDRCTGVNWVSALGYCGRELIATLAERWAATQEEARRFVAQPRWTATSVLGPDVADVRGDAADDLPALGSEAADRRYLRSMGGREALIGSSRTADVLFRLGSRHRFRANEEGGWDWYRFSDTTYETHLHRNGHKALGLELLVPFQ